MIVSENIKLTVNFPCDDDIIERALSDAGINPLRWAIVKTGENFIELSVSYVKES